MLINFSTCIIFQDSAVSEILIFLFFLNENTEIKKDKKKKVPWSKYPINLNTFSFTHNLKKTAVIKANEILHHA